MSQTDVGSVAAQAELLEQRIEKWAEAAVAHAEAKLIEDPVGMVATVAGLAGPWAFGETKEEALSELKSVLRDWAAIKLADGDRDIPPMKGIHLVQLS